MSKILLLEIKSCMDCPYYSYEPFYDMKHDSGWDCWHPDEEIEGTRVIDDGELRMLKDHDGPVHVIPNWCPLPNRSDIVDRSSDTLAEFFRIVLKNKN